MRSSKPSYPRRWQRAHGTGPDPRDPSPQGIGAARPPPRVARSGHLGTRYAWALNDTRYVGRPDSAAARDSANRWVTLFASRLPPVRPGRARVRGPDPHPPRRVAHRRRPPPPGLGREPADRHPSGSADRHRGERRAADRPELRENERGDAAARGGRGRAAGEDREAQQGVRDQRRDRRLHRPRASAREPVGRHANIAARTAHARRTSPSLGARGTLTRMDRWATFDCYGTLIDWNGGIRAALAGTWPAADPDGLLAAYHRVEPELEADGTRTYRAGPHRGGAGDRGCRRPRGA